MTPEPNGIDALLESLTSGEGIDWERAESRTTTDEERSRLLGFRDVARVADFHRTLQRDVASDPTRREVQRWGDLLLLERVGSGSTGDVYRAWDVTLQREVALKLLRPREGGASEAGDLLEEARSLARVRDPHIVTVHGVGEHEGRIGLWMEFLHGPTLEAEIARRGRLPAEEVARLGTQLGRALAAAHGAGALHRDVKPGNVILERDGRAVLMDFGLGQRRFAGPPDAGTFSGTPMFMSPLRLAGAPATASDDLYALGVTLRCALAGAPPLIAGTIDELRKIANAGSFPALRAARPDAPQALVAAIERAMHAQPSERFESATALIAAFEAAGAEQGASTARSSRVRAGAWLVSAVVVAVLGTLAIISRVPHRESAEPRASSPSVIAATAYDVSASLLRRGREGDVPLTSGDRVVPGDRLSLEFRATRAAWVYVLDADDRGESYLLFPQPFFDRKNPLAGNSTFVLPGTLHGRENAWTVTSRGGREHFLVVASPEPVPELEAELSRLPAPLPGRPVRHARFGSGMIERLRGVGGVSELPTPPVRSGPPALFERMRVLAGREQGVRGTWVRQITLENPLR